MALLKMSPTNPGKTCPETFGDDHRQPADHGSQRHAPSPLSRCSSMPSCSFSLSSLDDPRIQFVSVKQKRENKVESWCDMFMCKQKQRI